MKKENKKGKNYFLSILTILLCLFIFLRVWYDGISEPFINTLLVFYIFFLTIISYLYRKEKTENLPLMYMPFFLFVLFSFISSGISQIKGSGITYNTNILSFFCLMILISKIEKQQVKYLIYTLLFSCFVLGIYGIHQYYWGFEMTRQIIFSNKEVLANLPPTFLARLESNRIFSRFVYPNVYASFLLTVLPLSFFATFEKNFYVKFFSWTTFFIAFYNLLLTGSIGGILIFIFIFHLIFLFLVLPEKKFVKITPFLTLFEIIFVIFIYKAGKLPHIHSFVDRLNYWKSSINIFKESPILGVGPENFAFFFTKYKLPQSMEAKHAHSLFFETLVENGIIGTILLFSFLFSVLSNIFIKKEKQKDFFLYGIGFAFLSLLIHNIIDFDFVDPSSSFLFFILAGISIVLLNGNYRKVKLTLFPFYFTIILVCCSITFIRYNLCIGNLEASKNIDNYNLKLYFLERAEKSYPFYNVYLYKGKVLCQMGIENNDEELLKKGENSLKYSIYLNPYLVNAYRELSFLYQREGRIKESEKMYLKLIELYPNKKQFNLEVSIFYKSLKDEEKFKYFFEKSKHLFPVSVEEGIICNNYEKWIELQK